MRTLQLYGTSACHLCELAEELVRNQLSADTSVRVELLDVSESDELFARYGLRIPVLRHPDGRELDWPFTAAAVRGLLFD
ncbi:MAG: glutaredoxin family protein [Halioglobus sp.]|nr:glutaredoxin family protein [Halioglobus sp.]